MWKKLSRLGELPCDRKLYKFVKVLMESSCKSVEGENFCHKFVKVSVESSCKSVEGKLLSNNCPAVPNRAVFWLTSSLMVTKLSRALLDYK